MIEELDLLISHYIIEVLELPQAQESVFISIEVLEQLLCSLALKIELITQ